MKKISIFIVFNFVFQNLSSQWIQNVKLTTTQDVEIGANSTNGSPASNIHISNDDFVNFRNLSNVENIQVSPNLTPTLYDNCDRVLVRLSKILRSSFSSNNLFGSVSSQITSVPTYSIDISKNDKGMYFKFAEWLNYPKKNLRLNPITNKFEESNECPKIHNIVSFHENSIKTYVPIETNVIKGKDGDLSVNSNIIINGELRIKNIQGENEILIDRTGYIRAREIKVDFEQIPDYVFEESYNLMRLEDLESYIKKEKHLPNFKGEREFSKKDGISLGELNIKLLEKIEELTLYVLQLNKKNLELQTQINNLKR